MVLIQNKILDINSNSTFLFPEEAPAAMQEGKTEQSDTTATSLPNPPGNPWETSLAARIVEPDYPLLRLTVCIFFAFRNVVFLGDVR